MASATPALVLALWTAARGGKTEEAWQLLADGADLERKRGEEKTCALHEAARGGHYG
jgi:hypothetical protein